LTLLAIRNLALEAELKQKRQGSTHIIDDFLAIATAITILYTGFSLSARK
jgi:hypothetical protein